MTSAQHAGVVLAVLELDAAGRCSGHRFVDPARPQLDAGDLAATRGDGVFETISVGSGRPQALEPHLARLARSAHLLDLPAPDVDAWRGIVREVAEQLRDHAESYVKIVLSRGVEGTGVPSGWAWGAPAPDHTLARTEGIAVITLDRGLRSDAAHTSPWLLAGAKTLSYAMNMAVKREAERRGAADVVFVSSDGVLLEGGTSNLVLRIDGRLVTPRTDLGILAGTSQADAFAFAEARGIPTAYERLGVEALDRADAGWLLSSVRHAAPLHTIDERHLDVDREFTTALNGYLLARAD